MVILDGLAKPRRATHDASGFIFTVSSDISPKRLYIIRSPPHPFTPSLLSPSPHYSAATASPVNRPKPYSLSNSFLNWRVYNS